MHVSYLNPIEKLKPMLVHHFVIHILQYCSISTPDSNLIKRDKIKDVK